MTELIVVETTVESRQDAEKIASELVEKRLAACVQIIGPITSIYRWKGQIEKATEFLCLIKSQETCRDELRKQILDSHPYDEPQVIELPVTGSSDGYRTWVLEQTSSCDSEDREK